MKKQIYDFDKIVLIFKKCFSDVVDPENINHRDIPWLGSGKDAPLGQIEIVVVKKPLAITLKFTAKKDGLMLVNFGCSKDGNKQPLMLTQFFFQLNDLEWVSDLTKCLVVGLLDKEYQ